MKTLTKTTLFALSAVVALGASNNSADAQVVYVVRPHHHVVVPAYRVAPYGYGYGPYYYGPFSSSPVGAVLGGASNAVGEIVYSLTGF